MYKSVTPFAGLIEFIVNFRRTYLSTLMAVLRPFCGLVCAEFALSFCRLWATLCSALSAWYRMHTAAWNFNCIIMRWKFVRTLGSNRYSVPWASQTSTFSFRVSSCIFRVFARNNKTRPPYSVVRRFLLFFYVFFYSSNTTNSCCNREKHQRRWTI